MKNKLLFLSTMLLTAMGSNAIAQTWGGTMIPTYTSGAAIGDVIGFSPNSRLYINQDYTGMYPYSTVPGLILNEYVPLGHSLSTPPPANFFEITKQSGPVTSTSTPTILDVFNNMGYLGILQSLPAQPLDVNGKALIEDDLAVQNHLNIGATSATYPDNARLQINNTVSTPGALLPEIQINRNTGVISAGSSYPNFLEIWNQGTLGSNVLMDVVSHAGYLGILTNSIAPTQPLDVNGNALIRKNLIVNQNGTIDKDLYVHGGLLEISTATDATNRVITINNTSLSAGSLQLESGTNGAFIGLNGRNKGSSTGPENGSLYLFTGGTTSYSQGVNFFYKNDAGISTLNMLVRNVGLISMPGGYIDMTSPIDDNVRTIDL